MSFKSRAVNLVANQRLSLIAAVTDTAGTSWGRSIAIAIPDDLAGVTVYQGGADLAAANGFPLRAGRDYFYDLDGDEPFLIADGDIELRVLHKGV